MMNQNSLESKPLVNRVANSGLININLENYFPDWTITLFDLKDHLFQGLILKEKDFRATLKAMDWSSFQDHALLVFCSTDAIIPTWAYMLVAAYAEPYVRDVYFGTQEQYLNDHYRQVIQKMNGEQYTGERVVIKGCSNKPVPAGAYLALTALLQPYAQSIMYGEPCSTVPIFKRPRVLPDPV